MTYTVVAGDTFWSISQRFGITVDALEKANPGINANNIQVGTVLNIPGTGGTTKYTIKNGDTFWSISQAAGCSVAELEAANPGVNPNNLQVGQVINVPGRSGGGTSPPTGGEPPTNGNYVNYSGPASNFPDPNTWASWDMLWAQNSSLIKSAGKVSDSEIALEKTGIETVSQESGVDKRVILCIMVQESGGNPRIPTSPATVLLFTSSDTSHTNNGVRNPGLMQSHNGVEFNPSEPGPSITQMLRDGTEGVQGPGGGDGLEQCFAAQGNWYAAFRQYNSGPNGVNKNDLNDPMGATASYVRDAANRLMGHTWNGM